jgi:hypothetical protein
MQDQCGEPVQFPQLLCPYSHTLGGGGGVPPQEGFAGIQDAGLSRGPQERPMLPSGGTLQALYQVKEPGLGPARHTALYVKWQMTNPPARNVTPCLVSEGSEE